MKPAIAIRLMGITLNLSTYSLAMGAAALAVFVFSLWAIRRKGLPMLRSLGCLLAAGLSVPVGARALNVAINPGYYSEHADRILKWSASGFSVMGGLLLAIGVAALCARFLRVPIWPLGDAVAPPLGLALALMKLGCYCNGCCYGTPSALPWAVRFLAGSPAYGHYLSEILKTGSLGLSRLMASPPLHPVQLYEGGGALVAAAAAWYLQKRQAPAGVPALGAALVYLFVRFITYFYRVMPASNAVPVYFYPVLYILLAVLCGGLIASRVRTGGNQKPQSP